MVNILCFRCIIRH